MTRGKCPTTVNLWFVFLVVFAGLASPPRANAQATATINGTVRDSTGAVIPDATVVLHANATNLDQTTTTNSVGAYVISQIHPGEYSVKVTKTGFRTEVTNLSLNVNQTATVDLALSAGGDIYFGTGRGHRQVAGQRLALEWTEFYPDAQPHSRCEHR